MKRPILTTIITVLVLAALTAIVIYSRADHYKALPDEVVGNSAGNMRGDGLFCEYDGKVYFSNAYDGGALYVMNADGTEITRLSSAAAKWICVGGDYIYYYLQTSGNGTGLGYVRTISGIYRCLLNGKKTVCLHEDAATSLQLVGNQLFYEHYDNKTFSTFRTMTGNGEEEQTISALEIDPSCAANGVIYYGGLGKDHYLHALNAKTLNDSILWAGNLCYPTVVGDYVYYMDIDHDYRLCRYSMSRNEIEILCEERLDFYNLYGMVIYYQVSDADNPRLMRMNVDGSNQELVAEGVYNRINTTSTYTYFYPYDVDGVCYRTPTAGAIRVEPFTAAQEAASEYHSK
ncbi:MAG: DUF5050 domain-containing protein [Lachnospiraceae bacterium]|nr:DUF5050 domain-containing protein [Lachnospiraceae bacterium]